MTKIKKKDRIGILLLVAVLVLVTAVPTRASDTDADRSGNIYVEAKADGMPEKVTVSDALEGNKTAEELPVSVKVSYYLDGKRMSPEKMKGCSALKSFPSSSRCASRPKRSPCVRSISAISSNVLATARNPSSLATCANCG